MAYTIVGTGSRGRDGVVTQYICDTAADIASLPTGKDAPAYGDQPAPGSTALDADGKEIYTLTPSRAWVSVLVLP